MSSQWDEYVRAELRIETPEGPVHVYPAPALQATGDYPDAERRPIAVITAHNPGGDVADPEANAQAQFALRAELLSRGLTWWPAEGANPEWTHVEERAAIPGLSQADAVELGAKFGQEAVFLLTPTGLKIIDVASGRMTMTGWHIEPFTGHDHDHEDDDDYDDAGIRVTVHARPVPRNGMPGLVLAESIWDDDDPADPPGGEYLLRTGDGYAIYQTNGHESETEDLAAATDQSALDAFKAYLGIPDLAPGGAHPAYSAVSS